MNRASSHPPVIDAASQTHPGMRREVNEDAVLAAHPVYIVADGMGGHAAGDLASAAAVEAFAGLVGASSPTVAEVDAVLDGARTAVAAIAQATQGGAGCTLTGTVLVEHESAPHWYIFNIGDSRVYHLMGATFTQISDDHSLHAELVAAGDQNAESVPRNVITRALGSDDARHDGWLLSLRTGSRLLICSDGLTSEVSDDEVQAVLTVGGTPQTVADELVRIACQRGGRDNITVIVVDVVSAGHVSGPASQQRENSIEDTQDTLEVTRPVAR